MASSKPNSRSSRRPAGAKAASVGKKKELIEDSRDGTRGATGKPLPFVRPGQPLHLVEKLKGARLWPPSRGKQRPSREGPTTTPYLVVPAVPGDLGLRPIADQEALYNASVHILDSAGNAVTAPKKGTTYTLACRVINRGGIGAFGGMAEFYVARPGNVDLAASTPGSKLPTFGFAGLSTMPGGTSTVTCPNAWTPATDEDAASTVLVHVYDAFADKVTARFDAQQDRHVGRRDSIPDFGGIWDGLESANSIHGAPTRIRIAVSQNFLSVVVGFYMEVGSGFPAMPQDTATGTILNGLIKLDSLEQWGPLGVPFTFNKWSLSMTATGLLHFTHHRHYLIPGDPRPDTDTVGDLIRL